MPLLDQREAARKDRRDVTTLLGRRRPRATPPDYPTEIGGPLTPVTWAGAPSARTHSDATARFDYPEASRISQPAGDLQPGDRLRGYVVERRLAAGGFGTVYLVEHEVLRRPAALKVLHPDLATSPEAISRFEREARLVSRIRHRNVIDVHAFGRLPNGRCFFVMEYLHGEDLDERLQTCGRLSPQQLLDLFDPLCHALAVVHQHGIIHRDLKASNVFLADEGDRSRVVLLDFGVAKLLNDPSPELTTSRHVVGTPACMAPEQIRGEPIDSRTDVYALGALAYHCLTGSIAFSDKSPVMVQHLHLHAQPPRPSEVVAACADLDRLIVRAMAKTPSARPRSALAFLSQLREVVLKTTTRCKPCEPARTRSALALYLEVLVDDEHLAHLDDTMLSDLDSVCPAASKHLTDNGFVPAIESGTSLLFVKPLPDEASDELAARGAAVETIRQLQRILADRPGRDSRLHVNLSLERGPVLMTRSRALGGQLLHPWRWASHGKQNGAVGSAEVFTDLDVGTERVTGINHVRRLR